MNSPECTPEPCANELLVLGDENARELVGEYYLAETVVACMALIGLVYVLIMLSHVRHRLDRVEEKVRELEDEP